MGRIDQYPEYSTPATLGYAEKNTNQTFTASGTVISGLSVTVTVPAGSRIRISTQGVIQNQSGVVAYSVWAIRQDTVRVRDGVGSHGASGNNTYYTHEVAHVLTPAVGAHTYDVIVDISNANQVLDATGVRMASILVEDIT